VQATSSGKGGALSEVLLNAVKFSLHRKCFHEAGYAQQRALEESLGCIAKSRNAAYARQLAQGMERTAVFA
jgi:hypothetical protein